MEISADKIYLLILIPIIIAAAVFVIKKYMKGNRYIYTGTVLRILTVTALILSLSGMSIVDKASDDTTLFLVDVSDSASGQSKAISEFINSAQSNKDGSDKTAVSLFGGRSVTVVAPTDEYVNVNLSNSSTDNENTNIEAAIKQAASVFDKRTNKRLVIITDGSETRGDGISARNVLKNENIQTLIYDVSGGVTSEAGIREISLPQYVNINMNYDVSVIVDSIGSQQAELRLYRGTSLVLNEKVTLKDGENRYIFTDMADKGGGITYRAEIVPQDDTFYQNNTVYGYCYAENLPSVLVVGSGASAENLRNILESAQLNVDVVGTDSTPTSYDALTAYDSVILADVAYNDMNQSFVSALDDFVKYAGGGLITIGGENAYGPGGYEGTPIEDMLPVDMSIKTQSEDPNLAMIMVIDRSGSMSDNSQGISCMDLAKEAAIRGVKELDDEDMVGVVAFDSAAQWVVELEKVGENRDSIETSIGTIQAGGGTSILPALRAACTKLSETDTKLKHVILLTDGQAETEGYSNLLKQAREDGITISTIAVGPGADTKLLQYIAEEGNGRYYYADRFSTLPEIFVYETSIASKDYLNNEDFYPSTVDASEITQNIDSVPMLHGYVSTTAKPRADVVLQSEKEEPVLAVWQYGLGRTAAWTSDLSGQWTSDWLASDEGLNIIRNLISYSMRSDILYDIEVTGEAAGGVSEITAKIPVNQNTSEIAATIVTEDGEEYKTNMSAILPGEYKCTIPTDKEGAYIITVEEKLNDGTVNAYNTGFVIGYSGEYDVRKINSNGIINELSSYENIKVITSPDEVYSSELPDTYAERDITVPLLIMAIVLLILDILLRRFPEIIDKSAAVAARFKPVKKTKKASFEERIKQEKETQKKDTESKIKEEKVQTEKKSSASTLADLKRHRKK